jgi:phosphopantothenoylcysteine decarboxylase/phosphopantothenate--cysteine ligase
MQDEGAGFQSDTNKVTYLDKSENILNLVLQSKKEVAKDIINHIMTQYHA